MSESTPKAPARTVEEIHREYSSLCAKIGHSQYQIFSLEREVERMNETCRDLNLEAAKVAAEAAKPAVETKENAQA